MGRVDTLVAEDAAHLVDAVDATDDGLLEVELEGDAQRHLLVERVEVRLERTRRSATVDELEDRGLDLDVALALELVAHGAVDLGLGADHVARLLAHDEVGVALPHAALLGELLVQDRHGAQGLGGHRPARGHDGEFATAAADDATGDGHVVAEVDVGLPGGEGVLAHLREAEHDLEADALALLQGGERELAGVADEDEAAGDGDDVVGLLPGLEVTPLRTHLGEAVGPVDRDWIGQHAGAEKSLALLAADALLLGQVDLGDSGGSGISRRAGLGALHGGLAHEVKGTRVA